MTTHLFAICRRELIQIGASTVAVGALNALITSHQRRAVTTYAFHDEFDGPAGSAPNPALWGYDTGRWTDNNELETYTSSRANSYLDGKGHLVIRALPSRRRGHGYSSARLQTQGKFSQNDGTWEARIKCDLALGTWPAWWLLGDNICEVGWPHCGEVDMLEVYGQPGWGADSTVHVADANGTDTTSQAIIPGGVDTGWHVWRLWCDPATGNLQFYKDPGADTNPIPDRQAQRSTILAVRNTGAPRWRHVHDPEPRGRRRWWRHSLAPLPASGNAR